MITISGRTVGQWLVSLLSAHTGATGTAVHGLGGASVLDVGTGAGNVAAGDAPAAAQSAAEGTAAGALASHAGTASAHHARYTDGEADARVAAGTAADTAAVGGTLAATVRDGAAAGASASQPRGTKYLPPGGAVQVHSDGTLWAGIQDDLLSATLDTDLFTMVDRATGSVTATADGLVLLDDGGAYNYDYVKLADAVQPGWRRFRVEFFVEDLLSNASTVGMVGLAGGSGDMLFVGLRDQEVWSRGRSGGGDVWSTATNVGQDSCWLMMEIDLLGACYASWYSLNAAGSRPGEVDWILHVENQAMDPVRFSDERILTIESQRYGANNSQHRFSRLRMCFR